MPKGMLARSAHARDLRYMELGGLLGGSSQDLYGLVSG